MSSTFSVGAGESVDWERLRMTENDWERLGMTGNDWERLRTTGNDWE